MPIPVGGNMEPTRNALVQRVDPAEPKIEIRNTTQISPLQMFTDVTIDPASTGRFAVSWDCPGNEIFSESSSGDSPIYVDILPGCRT
ncbi:hypothetical protein [Rhodococcoides kroppenstedtii]|uniref:hypothetical protein n=1 Tax=Rhodococcoides kroppenstedtii TaxID=293050 RepID=UPI00362E2027